MSKLRQTVIVMTIALAMSVLVGCEQKQARQQWEYKVVHFERDEYESMETLLNTLGNQGWEYAGTLCNNGINARFVAFKRPK